MARLLLPLEHDTVLQAPCADALKRLPRRMQQVFLLSCLDQLDLTSTIQSSRPRR